jgi:hypothetical protein
MPTLLILRCCTWSSRHELDFASIAAPDLCIPSSTTHGLDSNGTAKAAELVPMHLFHKIAPLGRRIKMGALPFESAYLFVACTAECDVRVLVGRHSAIAVIIVGHGTGIIVPLRLSRSVCICAFTDKMSSPARQHAAHHSSNEQNTRSDRSAPSQETLQYRHRIAHCHPQ